jgi:hypothetical protein
VPCGNVGPLQNVCGRGTAAFTGFRLVAHSDLEAGLDCEADYYYGEYYISYAALQANFRQGHAAYTDERSKGLEQLVGVELNGIWGDIYVDNTKRKLLHNNESAADEGGNIHIVFSHYWDIPGFDHAAAPGVEPGGRVDFYTVSGPYPLKLQDFLYVNN